MAAGTIALSVPGGTSLYQVTEKKQPIFRTHVLSEAECKAKKGSALEANEVVQLIPVYAGEYVTNVWTRVLVPSTTSSSTFSVGDGDNAAGYITTANCTDAANTFTKAGAAYVFTQATSTEKPVTWVGGKYYSANDTIDVKLLATIVAANDFVLEVTAEIIPVN